jgi:hypothetical protein
MQKIGTVIAAFVIVISILAFASGNAMAEDKKGSGGGDNKGSTPKVKVYDFSGDTIEGDLVRPEGTTVDARDFAKHSSLIRIRTNFIPEIIKSAEDL